MGFFSRLFGRSKDSKNALNLTGPGTFSCEIMGESHYQDNLEDICGGRTEEGANIITQAALVLDDDNPYDSKAVRVDIGSRTVGHLTKTHARDYRRNLMKAGHPRVQAICKARIVGGWDRGGGNAGYFGVKLDLPHDYLEPKSDNIEVRKNEFGSTLLTFDIDKPNRSELSKCHVNDPVNLWMPPNGEKRIVIFARGSIGGSGRIGFVPPKCFKQIAERIRDGLQVDAEIVKLTNKKCRIKCKLLSKSEIESETKVVGEKLRAELTRKYRPKKGFTFKIELPKTHKLQEGQPLYLAERPVEYYIKKGLPLTLEFLDQNGNLVAKKTYEVDLIRRMLKAYFNDYKLDITISHITVPDEYTLPYVDSIEATAGVIFHDNTSE